MQIAANSQPALLREVLTLACDNFAPSEASLLDVLTTLDRKIEEFSAILQLDVGSVASLPTIVANAAVELIQLTLASNAETARLRQEKMQADREVLRLQRIAHRLRREATRDRLTGLFNRAYFDEALVRMFRQARRRCTMLGLVFLDLDSFKGLNDRAGHALGDLCSRKWRRPCGARCDPMTWPDATPAMSFASLCRIPRRRRRASLAHRIAHAVRSLMVRHDTEIVKVTASVGAIVCVPQRTCRSPTDILAAADKAMYNAKAAGGNGIHFVSLAGEDDVAFVGEVRQRLFSTFLREQDIVSEQQVRETLRSAPLPLVLPGRLARRMGWITARQAAPFAARAEGEPADVHRECLGAAIADSGAGLHTAGPGERAAGRLGRRTGGQRFADNDPGAIGRCGVLRSHLHGAMSARRIDFFHFMPHTFFGGLCRPKSTQILDTAVVAN